MSRFVVSARSGTVDRFEVFMIGVMVASTVCFWFIH
jgi:hypothetical protein